MVLATSVHAEIRKWAERKLNAACHRSSRLAWVHSLQGAFSVFLRKYFSGPQPTIKPMVCYMPFSLASYTDNGVFLWSFHRTCLNTTLHCHYVCTDFKSELAGQLGGQKQLFKYNLHPFRKRSPHKIHHNFPGCFVQATPEVMQNQLCEKGISFQSSYSQLVGINSSFLVFSSL